MSVAAPNRWHSYLLLPMAAPLALLQSSDLFCPPALHSFVYGYDRLPLLCWLALHRRLRIRPFSGLEVSFPTVAAAICLAVSTAPPAAALDFPPPAVVVALLQLAAVVCLAVAPP
ncbi:hypothetical protein M758_UG334900 [Ceratodon purpureus]|nr:hypothetical protein M758_UG334900 [Ceratodon purpureus]